MVQEQALYALRYGINQPLIYTKNNYTINEKHL